jgi:hypothetical protein
MSDNNSKRLEARDNDEQRTETGEGNSSTRPEAKNDSVLPAAAAPSSTPPRSPGPGTETILTLVTGVLAAVASVYIGTHSALITIIAAAAALTLAAMVLHRK